MRIIKGFFFIIIASTFLVYMLGDSGSDNARPQAKETKTVIEKDVKGSGDTAPISKVPEEKAEKVVSPWYVSEETSQIDDSKTVTLSTVSTTTIPDRYGRRQGKASLVLRCMENTTSMYMKFNGNFMADHGSYGNVTMRIDDKKAFTRSMKESTDNMALGLWSGGRSIPVIKKLMKGDELIVRATPFNESSYTMTFNIKGLAEKVVPLRKACHW